MLNSFFFCTVGNSVFDSCAKQDHWCHAEVSLTNFLFGRMESKHGWSQVSQRKIVSVKYCELCKRCNWRKILPSVLKRWDVTSQCCKCANVSPLTAAQSHHVLKHLQITWKDFSYRLKTPFDTSKRVPRESSADGFVWLNEDAVIGIVNVHIEFDLSCSPDWFSS